MQSLLSIVKHYFSYKSPRHCTRSTIFHRYKLSYERVSIVCERREIVEATPPLTSSITAFTLSSTISLSCNNTSFLRLVLNRPLNMTITCTVGITVDIDIIAVPAASVGESLGDIINELNTSVVSGRYLRTNASNFHSRYIVSTTLETQFSLELQNFFPAQS